MLQHKEGSGFPSMKKGRDAMSPVPIPNPQVENPGIRVIILLQISKMDNKVETIRVLNADAPHIKRG